MKARVIGGAALSLVLLAGCGGSSSSSDQTAKFKSAFQSVTTQFQQTSSAIGEEILAANQQTDGKIATAFHDLATRWQGNLSQLETLTPPSNLATDFNTLRDAATRAEADLNAIVSAAATHSKTAAEQGGASIVQDVGTAKSTAETLDSKLGIKSSSTGSTGATG